MRITVFGATGHLGRHVLAALMDRGTAADDIVAAGREISKVQDLAVRPVRVDYGEPDTIRAAVSGAARVLLISGFDFGRRVEQHAAVVEAARRKYGVPPGRYRRRAAGEGQI
jgi:NAD(P)H dehydrogenase (quinone)